MMMPWNADVHLLVLKWVGGIEVVFSCWKTVCTCVLLWAVASRSASLMLSRSDLGIHPSPTSAFLVTSTENMLRVW